MNTNEVKALLKTQPTPVVVDVYSPRESLPGAIYLKGFGSPRPTEGRIAQTRAALDPITGGDRNRAIVFLCASSTCWLSDNAALFALEAGYSDVLWYRGGLLSWKTARQETATPRVTEWDASASSRPSGASAQAQQGYQRK